MYICSSCVLWPKIFALMCIPLLDADLNVAGEIMNNNNNNIG